MNFLLIYVFLIFTSWLIYQTVGRPDKFICVQITLRYFLLIKLHAHSLQQAIRNLDTNLVILKYSIVVNISFLIKAFKLYAINTSLICVKLSYSFKIWVHLKSKSVIILKKHNIFFFIFHIFHLFTKDSLNAFDEEKKAYRPPQHNCINK